MFLKNKNNKNMTKEMKELKKATMPLLKLLNKKYNPHVTVVVTPTSIELLSGEISIPKIYEFIKN